MAAYAFNTDLSERTPRPARFTPGTQAARFFLALLFVGGIVLVLGLAHRDLKDLSSLKSGGVITTAHITDKHESHGRSTSYYLNYEFLSGGAATDDEMSVSWNEYSDTNIGDPLTVIYLPSQPNIHRVGHVTDARIQAEQGQWGWIGLVTFLILGGIFLAVETNYRRHRALLRDGLIAPGQITGNRMVKGKSDTYYVRYHFEANGSVQSREVSVPARIYNALPEGTDVSILYDRRNPKRSFPYQALTDVTLTTQ